MNRPSVKYKVSFYGLRCYLNIETGDLKGTNCFFDSMISLVVGLHNFFASLVPGAGADGFPMTVLERYDRDGNKIIEREP